MENRVLGKRVRVLSGPTHQKSSGLSPGNFLSEIFLQVLQTLQTQRLFKKYNFAEVI